MNRPSSFDFLLGHRAAVWLATGTAALSALAWLSHATSWLVPLVALAARNMCLSARIRVNTWRRWTEAWDEMLGTGQEEPGLTPSASQAPAAASPTPAEPRPAARKPRPIPRSALVIAWLLLLGWFTARRNETPTEPRDGLLALCFVALTGWGAVAAVAALVRRACASLATPSLRTDSPPQRDPEPVDVVAQCLPVPSAPERAGSHVRDLLPNYARELLARSREAIPPATPHSATSHSNPESEQSS